MPMNGKKLDYEISKEFSHELLEIGNKLNQLERGRIYELSGATMDGYLATNIDQLRKMIGELLTKIQEGEDGTATVLTDIVRSLNI